jgi:hypothetical protein
MFRVSIYDLITANVWKVILQNFFTQKVNKRLDVLSHFLFCLCFLKWTKVDIWESTLKELNVELVAKKNRNIVNLVFDAQVAKYLITQFKDCLNDYKTEKLFTPVTTYFIVRSCHHLLRR